MYTRTLHSSQKTDELLVYSRYLNYSCKIYMLKTNADYGPVIINKRSARSAGRFYDDARVESRTAQAGVFESGKNRMIAA